jgi:hypothetical protein
MAGGDGRIPRSCQPEHVADRAGALRLYGYEEASAEKPGLVDRLRQGATPDEPLRGLISKRVYNRHPHDLLWVRPCLSP